SLLGWGARPIGVVVDPDLFPSPIVAVPGFLLLEEFIDVDTIPGAFVALNDPTLYPSLAVDTDVIFQFTNVTTGAALVPELLVDVDIFYSPSFLNQSLAPDLFVDVDIFGGRAHVRQGKASLFQYIPLSAYTDIDIFFSPVIELRGLVPLN